MEYYHGYKITKGYIYFTSEEQVILYACRWMVENESNLRETSAKFKYSITTFWRRIHKECKKLSPELYEEVKKLLEKNLEKSHNNFINKKEIML